MWTRHSLFFPLTGLLLLTGLSTMATGFFSNHAFLWSSLHENIFREVTTTTQHVGKHIVHDIEIITDTITTPFAHYHEMATALEKRARGKPAPFIHETQHLDRMFSNLELDFIVVVNRNREIIHAKGARFTIGTVFDDRGIEEALEDKRKASVRHMSGMQWQLQVFSPVSNGKDVVGVIVSAITIDQAWFNEIHEQMVLADFDSVLGSSFDTTNWPAIDMKHVRKTLTEHSNFNILNHEQQQGWFFTPITLIDETICLIVPIDLHPIHTILIKSQDIMIRYLVITGIVITLLSMGLYFCYLHPLRRLGDKMATMLNVCQHDKSSSHEWTPVATVKNELRRLEQMSETVSLALYTHIGNLRYGKKAAEESARCDPLTGLGNRLMFDELLDKLLTQSRRQKRQLAILYLDLDHFKPINDTYGHDIGDSMLQEVARRMKKNLRDSDAICRQGGDEFAVFLADCHGRDFALSVSKRILHDVCQPYHLNGIVCSISVSIGISLFPEHAHTAEDLIKKADEALYQAKKAGRGVCWMC